MPVLLKPSISISYYTDGGAGSLLSFLLSRRHQPPPLNGGGRSVQSGPQKSENHQREVIHTIITSTDPGKADGSGREVSVEKGLERR